MKQDVGYSIYLPTGYEGGSQRYPVIYWLHGRGGTESSERLSRCIISPTPWPRGSCRL